MHQDTISAYNSLALEYEEQTKEFWDDFPKAFIKAYAKSVSAGLVLIIGSGPGKDSLLLQDEGLKVICLDASNTMVKLTLEKGLPSVIGDLLTLPFPDGSFSGIWAYTSLLHIPEAELATALKEISRVLKPQGSFALGMIEGENTKLIRKMLSEHEDHKRFFQYYSQEELEKSLRSEGFRIINSEKMKYGNTTFLHFLCTKVT